LTIIEGETAEAAEDNLALMTVLDALDFQPVDPDAPATDIWTLGGASLRQMTKET
jgi:hypothetical protein